MALQKAISPIATDVTVSSVCPSVRLSHSCTLQKPLDGMRHHLAGTFLWLQVTLSDKAPVPYGNGGFWVRNLDDNLHYKLRRNRYRHWNIDSLALSFCKVVWRRYLGEVGTFNRTVWLIYPRDCTPISIKIGQHLLKLCTKIFWRVFMPRSVYGRASIGLTIII